jgi:ubiquinone/menaquinone biosynthesis C-methylase UbiE
MELEEYTKLAELEDRMWYYRSLHGHIARELDAWTRNGTARSPAVLDAGCGTGGLILRLRRSRPSWRFTGIDFMPRACELARERCGPEVDIQVASVTNLPFPNESFDAVVSNDVLCQVENPDVAVAEFYRVLRPGGIAVINVPAYMWMWSYHDDACQSKHRFTRAELRQHLTAAGFTDRRVTHWNALPFPAIWARRKLGRTPDHTSDLKVYPAVIESAFNGIMAIEHAWIRRGGRWGWGTSILAVAKKK